MDALDLHHADRDTIARLEFRGLMTPPEIAQTLEARLLASPEDLEARVQLLGFYFYNREAPAEGVAACRRHALWVLENVRPDSNVVTVARAHRTDTDGQGRCKLAWLRILELHGTNPSVHVNAAIFFRHEPTFMGTLLERAHELVPDHPDALFQLAHHYERAGLQDESLRMWEAAASSTVSPSMQLNSSQLAAQEFFKAGSLAKARFFAQQALDLAPRLVSDRETYGYAIHHGHIVLGQVFLSEGEVEGAKRELLEASGTPGAPALNSFGPDFHLAQRLFELGERETVARYCELCSRFWKSNRKGIPSLCERIRRGEPLDLRREKFRRPFGMD